MTSIFIAKILGVVLVTKALGVFFKGDEIVEMIQELKRMKLVLYLVTTLELIAGLVIVLTHNIWEGWPAVITVIGWLMILEGAYFMLFPLEPCLRFIRKIKKSKHIKGWASLVLVIGLYLVFKGFFS
jgi:hypothetical protein